MDRRHRVATNLHSTGLSYAEIGIFLGVSRQRAHQLIKQPKYRPAKTPCTPKPSPLIDFYLWLSHRIEEAKEYRLPTQYSYALKDAERVLMSKEPLLALVTKKPTS